MANRILKSIAAAGLIGAAALGAMSPAEAGHRDAWGAGLLGFGVGAVVGSALSPREVYVVPPPPHGTLLPEQMIVVLFEHRPHGWFGNAPGQTVFGLEAQNQSRTPLKFLSSPQFATVSLSGVVDVLLRPTLKPSLFASKFHGPVVPMFRPFAVIGEYLITSKR